VLICTGTDALDLTELAHWASSLSASSQRRAQSLSGRRYRQFVASRYWLTVLLDEMCATPVTLLEQQDGPPTPSLAHLHVSLSHSHDAVMVAFSWRESLGVDIEFLKPRDAARLAGAFFHPREREWLATLSADQVLGAFYDLWTAKEALAKAQGAGLGSPELEADVFAAIRAMKFWSHCGQVGDFRYSVMHCCDSPLQVYHIDGAEQMRNPGEFSSRPLD